MGRLVGPCDDSSDTAGTAKQEVDWNRPGVVYDLSAVLSPGFLKALSDVIESYQDGIRSLRPAWVRLEEIRAACRTRDGRRELLGRVRRGKLLPDEIDCAKRFLSGMIRARLDRKMTEAGTVLAAIHRWERASEGPKTPSVPPSHAKKKMLPNELDPIT